MLGFKKTPMTQWMVAESASLTPFRIPIGFQSQHKFSPTAESFGVSAQIGSGVVRGDPELRFHQGSTRHQGFTRVPPGFHQGSTRVPPGFHQGFCVPPGLQGGPGWLEVRFHKGSTSFLQGFHQIPTRVPPGFHHLQGLGPGWFQTRFHEGSTRFHQPFVLRTRAGSGLV